MSRFSGEPHTLRINRTHKRDGGPSPVPIHPVPIAPRPVILTDLSKEFADNTVIQHLTAQLNPGGRYALRDPSGFGKTTLLYLLARLQEPTSGSIDNANALSVVFQEARLFEKHDAVENLQMIVGHSCGRVRIEELLLRVLDRESLRLPVAQLSGGMRRRVELCRALVHPSQLILLDEPFTGLDDASRQTAQRLLLDEIGERTLVIATHDESDRTALSAQVVEL